MVSKKEAH